MFSANQTNPQLFAEVVLPLAVPTPYTYAIPADLAPQTRPGMRVVVQVGARKLHTGIVTRLHHEAPGYPTKAIAELLDDAPIVTAVQLEFWQWLATYYLCYPGEVLNAAMPAGLKLQSESILKIVHQPKDWEQLSDNAFLLMEALENRGELSVQDAAKILDLKNPLRIIHQLMDGGFLALDQELKEKAKPKTIAVVRLARDFTEQELNQLFEELKNSPKQSALLLGYFQLKNNYPDENIPESELLRITDASRSSLIGLVAKQVFIQAEVLHLAQPKNTKTLQLSPAQHLAFEEINRGFANNKPVLLHGVTGSGKTEIYVSLLKEALQKHKRALYLVPEIALTAQLINRLQLHFGSQAVIYHSRLPQSERLSAYKRLLTDEEPLLLLGARSALLLPLPDLGLIVIDEEHDSSFKQQDPAPRYHARDSAVVLANLAQCPILLGSATPSAESFYNVKTGRFAGATLFERFGGVQMPEMEVVDIRKEKLWKTMRGHYSPKLVAEVSETLAAGKKAILFQNRRGYSPIIRCDECGHTQECSNCDITLTYHKYHHQLRCHYCGYSTPPPQACPQCGSTDLKEVGFGTEKLEEELAILVPEAQIERLDLDSTKRKNAFNKIINRFATGDINVLIGTQMVTKGLDFDDVMLVGILSADSMLYYPAFRAQERAFQLMEQVAGRAGRRANRGRVTIQTHRPEHRIIQHVLTHDYFAMIEEQLAEREVFKYPPFVRLIQIEIRHRDKPVVDAAAAAYASGLQNWLGDCVLGPEYPPIARLKNVYRKTILLKLGREISPQKVKTYLWDLQTWLHTQPAFKSARVVFDVDPN
jgi:primosomal protein N' (replication factor Y)